MPDALSAAAEPSRRRLLQLLGAGPMTVTALAGHFSSTRPAVSQHLAVLEASGLVRSQKVGRVRTCCIEPIALRGAERWIADRRAVWERRLDRLGEFLAEADDTPAKPRRRP